MKYKLPVKVIVVKNNTLGQIKWEQMVFLGNPEYGCDLHPIDFAAFARACGATGFTVNSPDRVGSLIEEALATPGPVILEAQVDPLEAPMFANMREEQAKKLRQALQSGQPDAEGIPRMHGKSEPANWSEFRGNSAPPSRAARSREYILGPSIRPRG